MIIPEPTTFRAALLPMIYFNWIIGVGAVPPARSRPVQVIMILYTVGFWIFYVFTFYTGISAMVPSYLYNISPMATMMYKILVYTNTCMSLTAPVLALMRRKGLIDCMRRIQKLDDTISIILGFEKDYRKIFLDQIYHILTICSVLFLITISDSLWLQSKTSFFTKFAIMFTFHQPILLMLATDLTFCGSMRTVGKRFQELNTGLLGLAEPDVAPYPRGRLIVVQQKIKKSSSFRGVDGSLATNLMTKCYLFHTIRKTHLELSKISEKFNSVFGIQILISMAVSSVMITGLLYTIYSAFSSTNSVLDTIREVMPPISWCIIYGFKIFMICYTCAAVSDEAQKSGQIIYDVLGATDKEFQKEIQEFALQMIQNPVRFSACGFFTLDYTYVQGVVGSITTYLVILIQMSDSRFAAPTTTVNKTAT